MGRVVENLDNVLLEVAQSLTSRLDLHVVMPMILDQLARLVNYDSASIMLLDGDELLPVAQRSAFPVNPSPMSVRLSELRHLHDAVVGRAPVLIADTEKDPRWRRRPGSSEIRNWLGIPLIADERVIGLLNISHTKPDRITASDIQTAATFAAFASIAINNSAIHQQLLNELAERERAEHALGEERELLARRIEDQTASLRAANQEMTRAARMKDEFLASMSHELRTPLNTIISMTDVLREEVYGTVNERQRRALERVAESGKHLLSLISDILDVARIESGHLHLLIQNVAIDETCRAVLQQVRSETNALDVHYRAEPALTSVSADARRLCQILLNLLSNAAKFTPADGAIGLEVSMVGDPDAFAISVWDTGIGISAEDLQRLFQPFVQLDSSLTRQYEGTGLGLTIIHRLTALHGGCLDVESELGGGSRFNVRLPQRQIPEPPLADNVPTGEDGRLSIVVITGLAQASEQLVMQLRAAGCRVEVVLYGSEGNDFDRPPDLIVINSHPPASTVHSMICSITGTAAQRRIPIAVASTLNLPGDADAARAAGADLYLLKPLSAADIQELTALAASRRT